MTPKITVLMAAYNAEAYLKECMDSVLGQTYGDYEFLIIDDGSTDRTIDIIASYKDDRIRLIRNEKNLSQVTSLNIGLDYAKGEYIARIDADDVAFPRRLEKQSEFLRKYTDIALIGSWAQAIDERSKAIVISRLPVRREEIIATVLFGGFIAIHSSFMFRKKTIFDIGKYNEAFSFCEDYKLIIDLLLNRCMVNNIPEVLAKYRVHNDRISVRDSRPQAERYLTAVRQFTQNFIEGIADTDRRLLSNFLINAGSMRRAYWEEDLNKTEIAKIIDLCNLLLANISAYFKLETNQMYPMKKFFYNRMLNFAYFGSQLKNQAAWELYIYCSKNWPYVIDRPKLYLCPAAYALSGIKRT